MFLEVESSAHVRVPFRELKELVGVFGYTRNIEDPDSLVFSLQRAEAKLLVEDWEGAVADFKAAIQQNPQVSSWWLTLEF